MVTKIEDLKKYAEGVEVGIPGFDAGEVITFKLKRPSLIDMARNGKIPNPLMDTAVKLFKDGLSDANSKLKGQDDFRDFGDVIRCVVMASMVSPTWEELEQNGITLTDAQLMYIYNYTVTGVDALKDFRKE